MLKAARMKKHKWKETSVVCVNCQLVTVWKLFQCNLIARFLCTLDYAMEK